MTEGFASSIGKNLHYGFYVDLDRYNQYVLGNGISYSSIEKDYCLTDRYHVKWSEEEMNWFFSCS
ncbi:hypothetical protein CMK18_18265 [Candidatus Poribacteria bacterium]|nr:hypothetical protein [Candidatus Poribacteria bacterium]